ncbi:MAG: carbon-monoxide dehydrogenase large subunit, partial [Halocynthiibacter sp.]
MSEAASDRHYQKDRIMEKFGKSQPVTRREDVRFLVGTGGYVDDVAPKDALHGIMFRSPVAHAEITALDL